MSVHLAVKHRMCRVIFMPRHAQPTHPHGVCPGEDFKADEGGREDEGKEGGRDGVREDRGV